MLVAQLAFWSLGIPDVQDIEAIYITPHQQTCIWMMMTRELITKTILFWMTDKEIICTPMQN